jgi:hypothetical protein
MRLLAILLFGIIPFGIIAQINYCRDTTINLTTQPNYNYNWNINGYITTEQSTQLLINQTGTYQIELQITNEYGCTSIDKRTIFADDCKEWTYYAPNAFVPDGINKTWIPVGENITIDLITIYTREGQVIFEGTSEWDGTNYKTGNECMGGVYVYTCDYTTITGLKLRDLGRVTLVR